MNPSYIIDAVRTPRGRGKAGKGALSGTHPQELFATVLRALPWGRGIAAAAPSPASWVTARAVGCVAMFTIGAAGGSVPSRVSP